MGPNGIRKDAFLESAGDAAEGVHVTFGGLPVGLLPGKDFVERYEKRFGSDVQSYTVYGYEAADSLLDAIGRAHDAEGEVAREGLRRELLANRDYDGALSP